MTMRTTATLLLLATAAEAFAPPPSTTSFTALDAHIDTRKRPIAQEIGVWEQTCRDASGNYAPCAAISGHERRAMWETYAPPHGTPNSYGAIGCPGGGDWCYAGSFGGAAPADGRAEAKKRAATVAAALAGLGKGVGGARADGVGISIGQGQSDGGAVAALPGSSSGAGSVMGEDVRDARPSYAPYTHDGRVGSLGEIGAGGAAGPHPATVAMPSGKQVGSTGDYFKALSGFSEPPPPKKYGLGSWKK